MRRAKNWHTNRPSFGAYHQTGEAQNHCEEEQGVATAPAPKIVPKGKLSNEFIIEVVVRKYRLPSDYRQCAALTERYGIELSRKTLTDAILAAGSLLGAVVGASARSCWREDIFQASRSHHALSNRC